MEIKFSDADSRLYNKIRAASADLALAIQYGEHVLKKRWDARPWSRGSIYLQQSAFLTAMIISYGRAFGKSNGFALFPKQITAVYSDDEVGAHQEFIRLRDQVYAHTDSVSHTVTPYHAEIDGVRISDITTQTPHALPPDRVRMLIAMSQKIIGEIGSVRQAMKKDAMLGKQPIR